MSGPTASSLIGGVTSTGLSQTASSALSGSPPTAAAAGASTGATALGKLSNNYSDFLKLLMTQLQNQDPTSPMDTNAFTTELVQFSSVEQQINTNTSLTQLIQLTQSGEILQSSSMVGHTVALSNTPMPVQNGAGKINYTAASAGPVQIGVYNSTGTLLNQSLVTAASGANSWSWNAKDANGNLQPDGAYKVVVAATDKTGAATTLPYTVVGVATGVVKNGANLQLQLGPVTTDFANVQSVLD